MPDVVAGNLIVKVLSQMTEFKKDMDTAGSKFDALGKKIKDNKAAIVASGVAIGAAGLAITGAIALLVTKTATFGDNMAKMARRTGETVETLSSLGFAAERSGTNIGTIEKAIKRAAGNMFDMSMGIGEAKAAFEELDITVTNTDGSLKLGSEILIEFAEKTKDMTDSTKKAALAQEIFGRAGTLLLPLFDEGAEGMKVLQGEADKFGATITTVNSQFSEEFVDAMLNFKTALGSIGRVIGETLIPVLEPLINKLALFVAEVRGFLKDHPALTKGLIAAGAAFGVMATAVGAIMVAAVGLPALVASLGGLATIVAIGGPIILGLVAVAAAIAVLVVKWTEISAAFNAVWEEGIQPFIIAMINGFEDIWDAVSSAFNKIFDKINSVARGIFDALDPFISAAIDGFGFIWDAVSLAFTKVFDKVMVVVRSITGAFAAFFKLLGIDIPNVADLFDAVGSRVDSVVGNESSGIIGKWNDVKNKFNENMEEMKDKHETEMDEVEDKVEEVTATVDTEGKKQTVTFTKTFEDLTLPTGPIGGFPAKAAVPLGQFTESGQKAMADIEAAAEEDIGGMTEEGGVIEQLPSKAEVFFEELREDFARAVDGMVFDFNKTILEGGGFDRAFKSIGQAFKDTMINAAADILTELEIGLFKKIAAGIANTISSGLAGSGGLGGGGILGGGGGGILGGGGGIGIGGIAAVAAPLVAVAAVGLAITKGAEILAGRKERAKELRTKTDLDTLFEMLQLGENPYAAEDRDFLKEAYIGLLLEEGETNANAIIRAQKKHYRQILGYNELRANPKLLADQFSKGVSLNDLENIGGEILKRKGLDPTTIKIDEITAREIFGPHIKSSVIKQFHQGGIIPGIIGQERTINALAGEEVITRRDPRHTNNFGGINVNITGNNINSNLDMMNLARQAANVIMGELTLQTKFVR